MSPGRQRGDETHYDWPVQGQESTISLSHNYMDFTELSVLSVDALIQKNATVGFQLSDQYGRTLPEDNYLPADPIFAEGDAELQLLCTREVQSCAAAQDCAAQLTLLRTTGDEPDEPTSQLLDLLTCYNLVRRRQVFAPCVELPESPCTPSNINTISRADWTPTGNASVACSQCVESLEQRHSESPCQLLCSYRGGECYFRSCCCSAADHSRTVCRSCI